jgi:hypothetical protein
MKKDMAYVYAIKVDGVVRYIGKGRGRRVYDHVSKARGIALRRIVGETVQTTLFYKKLSHALLNGRQIEEVILVGGLSDEEAFNYEIRTISSHTNLWNLEPGGQGRTSESVKLQWTNPEVRARISRPNEIVDGDYWPALFV